MNKGKYSSKHIESIAFFGDANISEDDKSYKDAYQVSKILAEKDYVIVNGGGPGIMNASTSGAESVGGSTVSVTFDPENASGYEGQYVKNVTDKEVVTTNYIERMFGLMERGDLFLIFKGGSGTISEFGTAWVLAKLYFGHHKPFILFGDFWVEIIDTFKKNMNIDSQEMSVFEIVERVEDVLPAVERFEMKMAKVNHGKDCPVCVGEHVKKYGYEKIREKS